MKFGKYIKSMAHPAWADKYVDYKLLKSYLKPFEAGAVNQEYEDLFLSCLHAEINKVDSFFTAKEFEFLQEQRGFWDKVRQTKAEPCKKVCTTRQDLIAAFDGTEMGEVLECFVAFTSKVETLRDFVMLNLQAVVKITKKHDKHSDTYLQTDLVQQVHMRNFFRSKKFGELIADVEALAMHLISHLVAWDELPDGWDGKSACGAGFQCPICLEHLCNPILLPCGHRFCMKCVSPASYFKKGYKCAVCQQQHTLDVETVRCGSYLRSPPRENGNMSSASLQALTLASSLTSTPTRHPNGPRDRRPPEQDGGSKGAERKQEVAGWATNVVGGDGEIDYKELEKQISERLRLRQMKIDATKACSPVRASPVADLSQVALSMSWNDGLAGVHGFDSADSSHPRLLQHPHVTLPPYHHEPAGPRTNVAQHVYEDIGVIPAPGGLSQRSSVQSIEPSVIAAPGSPAHDKADMADFGIGIVKVNGALEVATLSPGGPAARTRLLKIGDVIVGVDPGKEVLKTHWYWQQQGDRRWIDVRGWNVHELCEVAQEGRGHTLWFRMRRNDVEYVAKVSPWQIEGHHEVQQANKLVSDTTEELLQQRHTSLLVAGGKSVTVPVALARYLVDTSSSIDVFQQASRAEEAPEWVYEITGREKRSYHLCTTANVAHVLAHLSAQLGLSAPTCYEGNLIPSFENDIQAAMNVCISTPDIHASYHRLLRQSLEVDTKLAQNARALDLTKTNLVPILAVPELKQHQQLQEVVDRVQAAYNSLEEERIQFKQESRCVQDKLLRIYGKIIAQRAAFAAKPSVVTWRTALATTQPSVSVSAQTLTHGGDLVTAKHVFSQRLRHACVLAEVAAHLQLPSLTTDFVRRIADALLECTNQDTLRWLLDIDPGSKATARESEVVEKLLLNAISQIGAREPVSQPHLIHNTAVARTVCLGSLRQESGACPLNLLDAGRLVEIAACVLDNGWRYSRVQSVSGLSTVICHINSEAILQIRHANRQARFEFRSSEASDVYSCNWDGSLELSLFSSDLLAATQGTLRSVQSGDGLFGSEKGQVGWWFAFTHRGRLILQNNGATLHLTRQGGLVFLPAQASMEGVVVDKGWARPMDQRLIKQMLNISASTARSSNVSRAVSSAPVTPSAASDGIMW